MSLALWLRAGRAQRGMSVEDVAKVTKIQARILDRLEAGKFDGLPAEVFVRGFVRSFARCVGLDETEALQRYSAIATSTAPPVARALVDSMSDLAPRAASRVTGPVMLVQAPPAVEEIAPLVEVPASSNDALPISAVQAEVVEAPPVVVAHAPEAPILAEASTATATAIEVLEESKKAPKKKARGSRRKRKSIATGTPAEATPVVTGPDLGDAQIAATEPAITAEGSIDADRPVVAEVSAELAAFASVSQPIVIETASIDVAFDEPAAVVDAEPAAEAYWAPKMPPVQASVPWRRSSASSTATTSAPVVPSLVIDDSAPDEAERVLEDRAAAKVSTTNAQRRSFLPPILLDREDRSARQGGLTLAVILLLLAAAVTLSYLMRRPSSTGDGITRLDTPALRDTLG